MFSFFKKTKSELLPKGTIHEKNVIMKFNHNSDLNCKKNLKKAKKLIKHFNIIKNVMFDKEIAYFLEEQGFKDPWANNCTTIGYRQWLELDKDNFIIISSSCCFNNKVLVEIQLKKLNKLKL